MNPGNLDLASVEHFHMKLAERRIHFHAKDEHETVVKRALLLAPIAGQILLGNADADLADVLESNAPRRIIDTGYDGEESDGQPDESQEWNDYDPDC